MAECKRNGPIPSHVPVDYTVLLGWVTGELGPSLPLISI